jgi:hypothetical protein
VIEEEPLVSSNGTTASFNSPVTSGDEDAVEEDTESEDTSSEELSSANESPSASPSENGQDEQVDRSYRRCFPYDFRFDDLVRHRNALPLTEKDLLFKEQLSRLPRLSCTPYFNLGENPDQRPSNRRDSGSGSGYGSGSDTGSGSSFSYSSSTGSIEAVHNNTPVSDDDSPQSPHSRFSYRWGDALVVAPPPGLGFTLSRLIPHEPSVAAALGFDSYSWLEDWGPPPPQEAEEMVVEWASLLYDVDDDEDTWGSEDFMPEQGF